MEVTDSAGVFIDAQPIAVVQSRDGHIRLERVGNEFAVGNVIAQDRILDVATERVELGAQFLADALERLVGWSEQSESSFPTPFLLKSGFFHVADEIGGSQVTGRVQNVLQRFHCQPNFNIQIAAVK